MATSNNRTSTKESTANTSTTDSKGETALHKACRDGQTDHVKRLLQKGANPLATNNQNDTCLHITCFAGHLDILKILLKHVGWEKINVKGCFDFSLLHSASIGGNVEIVRYLLQPDVGLNVFVGVKDMYGNSPIHQASEFGHVNVITELLKHFTIEEKGYINMTPLLSACKSGSIEAVQFLLDQSADVTAKDDHGDTCIHWCCSEDGAEKKNSQEFVAFVEMLFAKGADVKAKNENSDTCLHYACQYGHFELVKMLLTH